MLCLARRMKKGRNFGNAYKAIAMVTFMLMFSFSGCIGEDSDKTNGATDINDQGQIDSLVVAFEVKDTYTNIDDNPQKLQIILRRN